MSHASYKATSMPFRPVESDEESPVAAPVACNFRRSTAQGSVKGPGILPGLDIARAQMEDAPPSGSLDVADCGTSGVGGKNEVGKCSCASKHRFFQVARLGQVA